MDESMNIFREKAEVLIDALPYIRDFNQKEIVIVYNCANAISHKEEQGIMKDIALLKSIGMRPILVHDTPMGVDKFRENKRLAKLIELCGVKAVGVCGVDFQTIQMTLDNDYIPVITPNDIDTEFQPIQAEDTGAYIAWKTKADKLIFLSEEDGIKEIQSEKVYPVIMLEKLDELIKEEKLELSESLDKKVANARVAIRNGVNRVHIIKGSIPNGLLLEFFSKDGIGTVIMKDHSKLYEHEIH